MNRSIGKLASGATFLVAAVSTTVAACGGAPVGGEERTSSISQALTSDAGADAGALITISGTVADAQSPQAGITITLSGSAQGQVVTDYSGHYSFSVKPGGSYSLTAQGSQNYYQPPYQTCLTITPSVVNLNDLKANAVINFVGSGTDVVTNCAPASGSGAMSGSLTLSGTLTSNGAPVVGARVTLNGSAQGYRTTDETGSYSFAVNSGSYTVSASGACAQITPSVQNLNNIKTNTVANFKGTSCPPAPLSLCPTFDKLFGLSEPTSCNTVSSLSCAGDRLNAWAGDIENDYLNLVAGGGDCRFGQWLLAPIVNDFTEIGFFQQADALGLFALQIFGCAEVGNLDGPLNYVPSLIPPDLVRDGLKFTTTDIAALTGDYIAAVNQTLSDNGSPTLTAAEQTAILQQLDYAAAQVSGVVSSSSLSYSTCGM